MTAPEGGQRWKVVIDELADKEMISPSQWDSFETVLTPALSEECYCFGGVVDVGNEIPFGHLLSQEWTLLGTVS